MFTRRLSTTVPRLNLGPTPPGAPFQHRYVPPALTAEVWNTPDRWLKERNVTPSDILAFHEQRRVVLGRAHKHDRAELEALILTASATGVDPGTIRTAYLRGGPDMFETIAGRLYRPNPRAREFVHLDMPVYGDGNGAAELLHAAQRELVRAAAFELPQLAALRQPFVPPSGKLRFRHVAYVGYPTAAPRVVVEFKVTDLVESAEHQHKLRLLVGPRWEQTTDSVKIGCSDFAEPAQNMRLVVATLQRLVAEATSGDMFADVPLDTRAQEARERRRKDLPGKHQFPEAWKVKQEKPEAPQFVPKRLLELLA